MVSNTPFVGTPATVEGYTSKKVKVSAPIGAGIMVKKVGDVVVEATGVEMVYGVMGHEVNETAEGLFQTIFTSGEIYTFTSAGTLTGVVDLGTQALLNYDGTALAGFLVKVQ